MFNFKKPAPQRPFGRAAVAIPSDELPACVVMVTAENRAAIGQLLGGDMSPQAIDGFIKSNKQAAFQQMGQPYSAYDAELPSNPVAQLWQHKSLPDAADAVVIRRTGDTRFLVEAREGVNALVLHKGDPARGKGGAALLCFTAPGKPTQFVPRGDSSVFEGADFQAPAAREAEFGHVRDHVLRQCTHCTAQAGRLSLP